MKLINIFSIRSPNWKSDLDRLLSQVRNGITALKVDAYNQPSGDEGQSPMENNLL